LFVGDGGVVGIIPFLCFTCFSCVQYIKTTVWEMYTWYDSSLHSVTASRFSVWESYLWLVQSKYWLSYGLENEDMWFVSLYGREFVAVQNIQTSSEA